MSGIDGSLSRIFGDSDSVLVLLLLFLLYRQGADRPLLAALLYIALG